MEIIIRPFRPQDMDGLYFLDQRCHGQEQALPYSRLLATLLEQEVSAVVAAEEEQESVGRLAGALMVRREPWHQRLILLVLMVDPAVRRLGLGRRLMEWAGRLGQTTGCRELAAAEENGLPEAERESVMTGLGFRRTEELLPAYRSGRHAPEWVRSLVEPEAS